MPYWASAPRLRQCWWRSLSRLAHGGCCRSLTACILIIIFGTALLQPLRVSSDLPGPDATTALGQAKLPHRFWLYAAAVFLYGVVETLNGNWAVLYLSGERGVSAHAASLALTAFWVMVTLGRVFIAVVSRWVPARWIYVALPMLLVLVFQIAARVRGDVGGIMAFGLAGLACSAFLPLSISFGGNEFSQLSAAIAGGLIAFYQLGYGVAAFAIGPLRDWAGFPFTRSSRPAVWLRLSSRYLHFWSFARERRQNRLVVVVRRRHCERSEAIQLCVVNSGLLRRSAPRNDALVRYRRRCSR